MTDYESTDEQYEDRIATLATLATLAAEDEDDGLCDDGLCDECYGLWEPEEQGYDHRFGCSWYAY